MIIIYDDIPCIVLRKMKSQIFPFKYRTYYEIVYNGEQRIVYHSTVLDGNAQILHHGPVKLSRRSRNLENLIQRLNENDIKPVNSDIENIE